MKAVRDLPIEAVIWAVGLLFLAFYHPVSGNHFTLCPFSLIGLNFCPGCGLGRSISHLFHGEFLKSLKMHPLGIFAVIILSYRIIQLLKPYLRSHGTSN